MRFLKWSLIIDVKNTTPAYEKAFPHSHMPTLLNKDVFPNFKLKAEVVLTQTIHNPMPSLCSWESSLSLHSLSFENHFWLFHRSEGISQWRESSLAKELSLHCDMPSDLWKSQKWFSKLKECKLKLDSQEQRLGIGLWIVWVKTTSAFSLKFGNTSLLSNVGIWECGKAFSYAGVVFLTSIMRDHFRNLMWSQCSHVPKSRIGSGTTI